MSAEFKVAVIGSGPAGLSAAARAARIGLSHVLIERAPHLADTIFKYFRGKLVMATPDNLELRSELGFKQGLREEVLQVWDEGLAGLSVNCRLASEVASLKGHRGAFAIGIADGEEVTAEYVVLAIGVQGNLRKLTIPGAELPFVRYQLDDARDFHGSEIAVIGNGDSAIETALALAQNNFVTLVNRGEEFPRAKGANRSKIQALIQADQVSMVANAASKRIEPGYLVLEVKNADHEVRVPCDHVIARIGAAPPRHFVETLGVTFEGSGEETHPRLSRHYESENLPGLYVIGALAGYPLIKQCLNQGYEVIEYIAARESRTQEADYLLSKADELIQQKLRTAGVSISVPALVKRIKRVPLYASLTELRINELLGHSRIHRLPAGTAVCKRGDYAESVYTILDGEVGIQIEPAEPSEMLRLGPDQFFGELALLSGRRRTRTVVATAPSLLLEIDRNTMLRLVDAVPEIKTVIDAAAALRYIKVYLAPGVTDDRTIEKLLGVPETREFKPGEVLIAEGDTSDRSLYLVRKGSVMISRQIAGKEIVYAYLPAGNYVGEMATLLEQPRTATVRAAITTEAIRIDGDTFARLRAEVPGFGEDLDRTLKKRLAEQAKAADTANPVLIESFAKVGFGEATDVLLIDESLCIRCDNCEKACAETHDGISRLDREAGPTFGTLHVPTACRHCEDPHCMKDCPPDAIRRAPTGEVRIDDQLCIHCGNCADKCPYGVIQMAEPPPKQKAGLLSWLFFGIGSEPGADRYPRAGSDAGEKRPVKCDLCAALNRDPACVAACPTGAALRIHPEEFLAVSARYKI